MRKVVSIRLDEGMLAAAQRRARQRRRTLTNYVEGLIERDFVPDEREMESGSAPQVQLVHVIRTLKARRPELERMGVRHAAVFGSLARGEARPESDVDILVETDPAVVKSLFAYGGIQQSLEEWIGRPVDLAGKERLRPGAAVEAERDAIHAF
ncbi:MAG TPA: nucleotidyltransferase family protein [Alphaproteobacteria bacterium]|nr:nucleotidyltransferase family protein [Alphaproteobacteria bacterium]